MTTTKKNGKGSITATTPKNNLHEIKPSLDDLIKLKNSKRKALNKFSGLKNQNQKLKKCPCWGCQETPYYANDEDYEIINKVSENGDSIYAPASYIDELRGGQTYVNESKIRDIVNDELTRRLGVNFNQDE